jgi:NNP family nitrate/nitrite transporter-like MFS transporter
MYGTDLVTAGILASVFSMPSGIIRILGGWMSDKFGARKVMYWIFITSILFCFLLIIPRMEITSPGGGVMSTVNGTVTYVSDSEIHVEDEVYTLQPKAVDGNEFEGGILPSTRSWQYPAVEVGDKVKKKQLLAKGETHIYFEANMWVATVFIFIVGMLWGIGKAAVYKHIPNYFPNDIGAVGGMVGVLGGLGGFFSPIIFGYLLQGTGLWTSMWVFLLCVSLLCLWWMHSVIVKMRDKAAPETAGKFERAHDES